MHCVVFAWYVLLLRLESRCAVDDIAGVQPAQAATATCSAVRVLMPLAHSWGNLSIVTSSHCQSSCLMLSQGVLWHDGG
jgi:hypothetical protein